MSLYSGLLALTLAVAIQAQGGSDDCQCIEWAELDQYIVGDLDTGHLVYAPAGESGPQYKYPVNYGNAVCKTHDKDLPPMCTKTDAPSWCGQKWCYVDKAKCNLAVIKTQFFKNAPDPLYFSYETCSGAGGANTFSKSMASSPGTVMTDLIAVMNSNLDSVKEQIETSWQGIHSTPPAEFCAVPGICPCTSCNSHTPWKGKKVDFSEVGTSLAKGQGSDNKAASCLANAIGDPYRKVAAMESDAQGSRIGYQYYADQGTGSYVQWPAMDWCPRGQPGESEKKWDPRLRPWYASAVTGPKDVVIVVDVSGSMGQQNRYNIAAEATVEALNTLDWRDFASIVLFDGEVAGVYSDLMVPVTESERSSMQSWARANIKPKGGTSFTAGLWKALKIIQRSISAGRSAMCEKAILFITDGQDTQWRESDYGYVKNECTKRGTILFSYALGSGAEQTITKRLACDNRGVFYKVPDGADLGAIMARYYEYFALGTGSCSPTWTKYKDGASGEQLYAACSVIYDKTKGNPSLLGASCMDANMVASADTLVQNSKWQEFVCSVSDTSKKCKYNYVEDCHRERLRLAYDASAVCGFDTTAVPSSCRCLDSGCADDESFIDAKGYFCDTYVGDECTVAALSEWGYSASDVDEVRQKCKKSCGLCSWKSADQCSAGGNSCPAASSGAQCRPCMKDRQGQPAKVSGNNIDTLSHCCSADGQPCAAPTAVREGDDTADTANFVHAPHYFLVVLLTVAATMLAQS
jgi:Mg-chelatase subunit ChlD